MFHYFLTSYQLCLKNYLVPGGEVAAALPEQEQSPQESINEFRVLIAKLGDTFDGENLATLKELKARLDSSVDDIAINTQEQKGKLLKEIISDQVNETLTNGVQITKAATFEYVKTAISIVSPDFDSSTLDFGKVQEFLDAENFGVSFGKKGLSFYVDVPGNTHQKEVARFGESKKLQTVENGGWNNTRNDGKFDKNGILSQLIVTDTKNLEKKSLEDLSPERQKELDEYSKVLKNGVPIGSEADFKDFVSLVREVSPDFIDISDWFERIQNNMTNKFGSYESSMSFKNGSIHVFEATQESNQGISHQLIFKIDSYGNFRQANILESTQFNTLKGDKAISDLAEIPTASELGEQSQNTSEKGEKSQGESTVTPTLDHSSGVERLSYTTELSPEQEGQVAKLLDPKNLLNSQEFSYNDGIDFPINGKYKLQKVVGENGELQMQLVGPGKLAYWTIVDPKNQKFLVPDSGEAAFHKWISGKLISWGEKNIGEGSTGPDGEPLVKTKNFQEKITGFIDNYPRNPEKLYNLRIEDNNIIIENGDRFTSISFEELNQNGIHTEDEAHQYLGILIDSVQAKDGESAENVPGTSGESTEATTGQPDLEHANEFAGLNGESAENVPGTAGESTGAATGGPELEHANEFAGPNGESAENVPGTESESYTQDVLGFIEEIEMPYGYTIEFQEGKVKISSLGYHTNTSVEDFLKSGAHDQASFEENVSQITSIMDGLITKTLEGLIAQTTVDGYTLSINENIIGIELDNGNGINVEPQGVQTLEHFQKIIKSGLKELQSSSSSGEQDSAPIGEGASSESGEPLTGAQVTGENGTEETSYKKIKTPEEFYTEYVNDGNREKVNSVLGITQQDWISGFDMGEKVLAFQKNNGVKPFDGKLGPITLNAIMNPSTPKTEGGEESSEVDKTYIGLSGEALWNQPAFQAKVQEICPAFGANPEDLKIVFQTESYIDPKNNGTQVGLLQWTKETAADLQTSQSEILEMDALQQLDLVKRYFERNDRGQKLDTVYKLYLATVHPASLNEMAEGKFDHVLGFLDESKATDNSPSAKNIFDQNPQIAKHATEKDKITIRDFMNFVDEKIKNPPRPKI